MEGAHRPASSWSWRSVLRLAQTVAVPILLSMTVNHFASQRKPESPPALYLPVLQDIGFTPRTYPVTYLSEPVNTAACERVQNATANVPDTTAVILNWARFPNVLLIASLLCGPWLEDTIAGVVIWNNSPRMLNFEDMKHAGCTKERLHIYNAPQNAYFQGRFLACAAAKTPYCYIQDDDYLIQAGIIRSLRARLASSLEPHTIHLLPSHEHLSSSLREIHVPKPNSSYLADIHTSFAWLGHGAMMHRSQAQDFLSLMRYLHASPDEMQMADNYFTVLSNRVPEVWFDQSFELGGGNAFTVGDKGHERNAKHILRATQYLDSLARCGAASCEPGIQAKPERMTLPYFSSADDQAPSRWTRAACGGAACVLETNIGILPDATIRIADHAENMLAIEEQNLVILGTAGKQEYCEHPLSHAVDTRPDTAFRSFADARAGDVITLDFLGDINYANEWQAVEMVWLVDTSTAEILNASIFEMSMDNESWFLQRPVCEGIDITTPNEPTVMGKSRQYECSVRLVLASDDVQHRMSGRYFRARLLKDLHTRWTVFEIWLRGCSHGSR